MLTDKEIEETGLEIWQLNETETWIGHGLEDIKKGALKQTGISPDELFDDVKRVPVSSWSKIFITEQDEEYSPMYSYRNYFQKLLEKEPNLEYPFCLASTEF
tara:strand:+ start:3861 stop:4166 length:306 start_codon:yes stop_codon:yes gene_type:complete